MLSPLWPDFVAILTAKPGAHVSFADAAGTHTGIVASVDGHGNAVVGQLNPAIAGAPTVTKPVADLTPAK